MKSWKLRPPSARLRTRLFGPAADASYAAVFPAIRHWLAPAMAMCLFLLVMGQNSPGPWPGWQRSQSSNLLATVALNQPLRTRYYAPTLQHDRNTWQATFEWTNDSRAITSAVPFPLLQRK